MKKGFRVTLALIEDGAAVSKVMESNEDLHDALGYAVRAFESNYVGSPLELLATVIIEHGEDAGHNCLAEYMALNSAAEDYLDAIVRHRKQENGQL